MNIVTSHTHKYTHARTHTQRQKDTNGIVGRPRVLKLNHGRTLGAATFVCEDLDIGHSPCHLEDVLQLLPTNTVLQLNRRGRHVLPTADKVTDTTHDTKGTPTAHILAIGT